MAGHAQGSNSTESTSENLSTLKPILRNPPKLTLKCNANEVVTGYDRANAQFIKVTLDGVQLRGVIRVQLDTHSPFDLVTATITMYVEPDVDAHAVINKDLQLIGREDLKFEHLPEEEQERVKQQYSRNP